MWGQSGSGAPKLGLAIRNVAALDNGVPTRIDLDQRGAVIGRSATVDWSLPDPRAYISSRHCEIEYGNGGYRLIDVSTNGTFINGATERSIDPVPLNDGDVIAIGHYEIVVTLSGAAPAAAPPAAPPAAAGGWGGWDTPAAPPPANASTSGWGDTPAPPRPDIGAGPASAAWAAPALPAAGAAAWGAPASPPPPVADGWGGAAPAPAPPTEGWGAPQAAPAADWAAPASPPPSDGWGTAPPPAAPAAAGWGAPAPPAAAPPVSSFAAPAEAFVPGARAAEAAPNPFAWDRPAEQAQAASGWSSAAADRPSAPSADDVWGKIAEGNVVDWARGGFGQAARPAADPLGLAPPAALPAAAPPPAGGFATIVGGAPPAFPSNPAAPPAAPPAYVPPAPTPMPPQSQVATAPAPADGAPLLARFLAEAGLKRGDLKGDDGEALAAAGGLVRRLVAGLVVMLEARARAKSQMGAQSTALEFDGNNPIKFARTPEGALAQLLNPVERGFMPADRAVEDAFHDLQSHQIATLKAMQGALKGTLDRFSPTAIKARAESKGMMARILPGARDAALWQAYEREFGGVAHGSDEAFMEVFAREFKKAYEEQSARRPKR